MMKGTPDAARDGAGRGQSLVVPGMMFGPGCSDSRYSRAPPLGHQAHLQRRPAPEVRRCHRQAGRGAGREPARSRSQMERGARPLRLRHHRLGGILGRGRRSRPVQRRSPGGTQQGLGRRRLGARGRPWRMPKNRPRGPSRRSARAVWRWVRVQARPHPSSLAHQTDILSKETARWNARNGRCGKYSFAAVTGWITSTAGASTRPTPGWRCRSHATSHPPHGRRIDLGGQGLRHRRLRPGRQA